MKKWVMAVAVTLAAQTAWAQFPNTYAMSESQRYDPSTGVSGTLYVTVTFTGKMNFNPGIPCSTLHTPSVAIKMPNGGWTNSIHGTPTQACSNMAWSTVFTFDLNSVGCTNDLLSGPGCVFESDGSLACPMMGPAWWVNEGNFQSEFTFTSMKANSPTDLHATTFCTDPSTPPDNPGYSPLSSYGTGVSRQKGYCWRWTNTANWSCNPQEISHVFIQPDTRIDCTKDSAGIHPSN